MSTKSGKSTEVQLSLLEYKIETMQKRIDQLESMIASKRSDNVSLELVQMLMDMVRKGVVPVAAAVPPSQQAATQQAAADEEPPQCSTFDALTSMARRRTVI